MKMVVGLGNPGPKYARNRHNVGFMVLDRLAEEASVSLKSKYDAEFGRGHIGTQSVALLKPMTYMNVSGTSIRKAMVGEKVDLADIVVVHDELDLPPFEVRVKFGGGTAGHNGLKSIQSLCGADYARVRIGIGRPTEMPVESWVLANFDKNDGAALDSMITLAAQAVRSILLDGPEVAQNRFNTKAKPPKVAKPKTEQS